MKKQDKLFWILNNFTIFSTGIDRIILRLWQNLFLTKINDFETYLIIFKITKDSNYNIKIIQRLT